MFAVCHIFIQMFDIRPSLIIELNGPFTEIGHMTYLQNFMNKNCLYHIQAVL